jgi:formate dehydrogenase iron-sulfur subunit
MSTTHRTLIDDMLAEEAALPAVESFAKWHDSQHGASGRYSQLLPISTPAPGQQYAFEVNLDSCTGCKACVVACHSLNGLEDNESWRSTGTLTSIDWQKPLRQTVTTACHHCVDPACASGCPTLAYEKDSTTGIVRHLDDQCIGCSYCTMTCPYEVPQFEPSRGIVRKCDMCSQRLAIGEAPACVQSCPNGAIKIILVDQTQTRAATRSGSLLPTAPPSSITAPTTRYVSAQALPSTVSSENDALRPQAAHLPLVLMLVVTQLAVGGVVAAFLMNDNRLAWAGALIGFAGVGLGTLHLGRPLQAWRAWLGWRKSWLSREIIVFGAHGPCALGFALTRHDAIGLLAVASGIAGVICSGMVYHATQRDWWHGTRSVGRFLLSTALFASMSVWFIQPEQGTLLLVVATAWRLAAEARWQRCDDLGLAEETPTTDNYSAWTIARSVALLHGHFGIIHRSRFLFWFIGGILLPILTRPMEWKVAAVVLVIAAELIERLLFFRTAAPAQMPGWNPNRQH